LSETYSHPGLCPVCEQHADFVSPSGWFRDFLACTNCGSVVRERALALVLDEVLPRWRDADVHESSPAERGLSLKLRNSVLNYVPSQYFPDKLLGSQIGIFRNEDLERQTFPDERFDLVVTSDVMEHVFDPASVYREIYRTLRPGGIYLHTFPIKKGQTSALSWRAQRTSSGAVEHLMAAEYHQNPVDPEGSLVTVDYGYDISRQIAEWVPFSTRVMRFWDEYHGIIGEFTEVIVCKKQS
jgi:SAM-dependent methyltransferase